MLAAWRYIAADFLRDYSIDLEKELATLSWRKFLVLLSGLNPYGALAAHYDAELKRQNAEPAADAETQRQQAADVWSALKLL